MAMKALRELWWLASMPDDYKLWKCWWYATLYSASPQKRMQIVDETRKEYGKAN